MQHVVFKKPERKLDTFLVPIKDKYNNKIRIRITDDIIMQRVLKIKDQNSHVIECLVKDPAVQEMFRHYDKIALEHVIENCNLWFNTDFAEDRIQEMFLPTLNSHTEIKVLASSIIEPFISIDNTVLNSFHELLPVIESMSARDMASLHVVLEIQAQGIYIRSKRFGIRWLVRSLRIFRDETVNTESAFDASTKRDVNEMIGADICELEGLVSAEIEELQQKRRRLEEYIKRVRGLYEDILDVTLVGGKDADAGKEWAAKTEHVTKLIWDYQRGRLHAE